MKKETGIAIGVVTAASILILTGLFWRLFWPSTPEAPAVTEPVAIELDGHKKDDHADELPGRAIPDSYPDEVGDSHDVTRIILVDPDGEEITDLLSEKVIIDDKVVEQSAEAK